MTEKCAASCKDGSDCGAYPVEGSDKCRMHAGKVGDSHDGNTNAAKTGAYAESFMQDFLTEEEQKRVNEAREILGDDAGAQEHGRLVAGMCLEQFRRTGDERFIRRYESICDKFAIAPADEVQHSGELELSDVVVDFDGTDT